MRGHWLRLTVLALSLVGLGALLFPGLREVEAAACYDVGDGKRLCLESQSAELQPSALLGSGWYIVTQAITGARFSGNSGHITLTPTSVNYKTGETSVRVPVAIEWEVIPTSVFPNKNAVVTLYGKPFTYPTSGAWFRTTALTPNPPPSLDLSYVPDARPDGKGMDRQPYLTNGPGVRGSLYRAARINLVDCLTTGSSAGYTCDKQQLTPNQIARIRSWDGYPLPGTQYITTYLNLHLDIVWHGNTGTGRWVWRIDPDPSYGRWDYLFAPVLNLDLGPACTNPWLMDVPSSVQPGQSFTALVGLEQQAGQKLVVERVAGAYSGNVDAKGLPVYESRTVTTGPGGTAKVTFTLPSSAQAGSAQSVVAYPAGDPGCAYAVSFTVGNPDVCPLLSVSTSQPVPNQAMTATVQATERGAPGPWKLDVTFATKLWSETVQAQTDGSGRATATVQLPAGLSPGDTVTVTVKVHGQNCAPVSVTAKVGGGNGGGGSGGGNGGGGGGGGCQGVGCVGTLDTPKGVRLVPDWCAENPWADGCHADADSPPPSWDTPALGCLGVPDPRYPGICWGSNPPSP